MRYSANRSNEPHTDASIVYNRPVGWVGWMDWWINTDLWSALSWLAVAALSCIRVAVMLSVALLEFALSAPYWTLFFIGVASIIRWIRSKPPPIHDPNVPVPAARMWHFHT